MKSGLNKLFWGVLLISIHLNLNSFKIFPPFIGWIVILFGVLKIEKDDIWKGSTALKTTVWTLIILDLLEGIYVLSASASTSSFLPLLFYPVFLIMLELFFFHLVFEKFVTYFNERNQQDNVKHYIKKDKTYMILMGISLVLTIVSLSINHMLIYFVSSMIVLVSRIYMLTVLHSLRKTQREHSHTTNKKTLAKQST